MTTLDRVESQEFGRSAVAIRYVPNTLQVFETHFPRFPVLPGVLILEDLAAVANLALGEGRWRLAGAGRLRYRHYVRPGDEVSLRVEVVARGDVSAVCKATAEVDGRTVVTVRALQMDLIDSAVTELGDQR